jgi:hypothetical protein
VVAPDGKICSARSRRDFDPRSSGRIWELYTSVLRPIAGDQIQRIVLTADTLLVGTVEGFTLQVAGENGLELRLLCHDGIDPCPLLSFDVRPVKRPGGNGSGLRPPAGSPTGTRSDSVSGRRMPMARAIPKRAG